MDYTLRKKEVMFMMTEKMITLNNGVEIPQLALGTWIVDDNKVAEPVKTAIRLGYRHVDTAQAYANEVICCIKKVILFNRNCKHLAQRKEQRMELTYH